jgi:hypothetical protein
MPKVDKSAETKVEKSVKLNDKIYRVLKECV